MPQYVYLLKQVTYPPLNRRDETYAGRVGTLLINDNCNKHTNSFRTLLDALKD